MSESLATPRRTRQRRSPPSDNVSVSARIPRRMFDALDGISRATGMTVNSLAAAAIDTYLHNRGAYVAYQQGVPTIHPPPPPLPPTLNMPAPLNPAVGFPPPLPPPLDLPEADED